MEDITKKNYWTIISDNAKTLAEKVSGSDAPILVGGAILILGILGVGELMFRTMERRRNLC